jgi:hypothetical protein
MDVEESDGHFTACRMLGFLESRRPFERTIYNN